MPYPKGKNPASELSSFSGTRRATGSGKASLALVTMNLAGSPLIGEAASGASFSSPLRMACKAMVPAIPANAPAAARNQKLSFIRNKMLGCREKLQFFTWTAKSSQALLACAFPRHPTPLSAPSQIN